MGASSTSCSPNAFASFAAAEIPPIECGAPVSRIGLGSNRACSMGATKNPSQVLVH